MYCQMDKTFRIELALCEALAQNGGEAIAAARISECLPTADSPITVMQSSMLLDKLAVSDTYTYLPKGAKRKVDMSREILAEMASGRSPKTEHLMSGPFMKELAGRLQFFCRVELPTDSGAPSVLTGKHALQHMLKERQGKLAEGGLALSDLEVFHIFQHMMEPNEKKQLADMTDHVLESVKSIGPKKRAPKQQASTNSASSRGRGKGKTPAETVCKELDLFS